MADGERDRQHRHDATHDTKQPAHETRAQTAADAHHHDGPAATALSRMANERGPAASPKIWKPPPAGEWCHNTQGHIGDPINLYVHGDLHEIEAAFSAGGWSRAKPMNTSSNLGYVANAAGEVAVEKPARAVVGAVTSGFNFLSGHHHKAPHVPDPFAGHVNSMPVSDMVYKGQKQVASFEKDNDPTGGRHHFRIFDTFEVDPEGRKVWAIAASRDKGIAFDKHKPQTGFTTHVVDPNTDKERDLVLGLLEAAGHVTRIHELAVKFGQRKDGTTSHGAYDVVEAKHH